MQRSRKIFVGKCVAILSAVPIMMLGHSGGPDPRLTGAPGDRTCLQAGCHTGTAQAGGSVQLSFSTGTTYTPGQKLTVTLKITDPTAKGYGFQVSSRPASDTRNGQAGTFIPGAGQFVICGDEGTTRPTNGACPSGRIEFIEHNRIFSTGTITFDWMPPATDIGPVVFFASGNAVNANGREDSGDHVYSLGTNGVTLTPATAGGNQPTIDSVTNGATFQPGVESGSWVTIKGANLAATTGDWNGPPAAIGSDGILPTDLGGVKVTIGGKPAAIYFFSPAQINVQAPDLNGTGDFPVQVTTANGTAQSTVTVHTQAPGFFMFDVQDRKYIAGLTGDSKYLGNNLYEGLPFRDAKPGETVQLFGTGFGPTNPAVPTGKAFSGTAPLQTTPTATIGGLPATVQFAGLISGAGLYQINLVVPPDTPDGDQPVVVTVDGVSTQQNAFITIQK